MIHCGDYITSALILWESFAKAYLFIYSPIYLSTYLFIYLFPGWLLVWLKRFILFHVWLQSCMKGLASTEEDNYLLVRHC